MTRRGERRSDEFGHHEDFSYQDKRGSWREMEHVTSKRLQGEHGRRGPVIFVAQEGRALLRAPN